MSFYRRKSLKAGPLRFTASKSGFTVSGGIPGFRVGAGPRGNYVSIGRKGALYRTTISGKSKKQPKAPLVEEQISSERSSVIMEGIESVDTLQLQDSSSVELLNEINGKHRQYQFLPITLGLSFVGLVVLIGVNAPLWAYIILLLATCAAAFLAYRHDQLSKTVILFYELSDGAEAAFQKLHNTFDELTKCKRAWHISASGKVTNLQEWKRQAGASNLVERKVTSLTLELPSYLSTNIETPCISVGKQALYFFPDRVLVYEKGKVGAVSYRDLELQLDNTRFIEAGNVPADATIVGKTWQYVNKSGGPDKRYKNNRQLPIALYSELYFTSSSGLNELIQISQPDKGLSLKESFVSLASAQSDSKEQDKSQGN